MKSKSKIILMVLSIFLLVTACQPISERLSKTVEVDEKKEGVSKPMDPVVGGEITLPLTNFSTLNPLITENQSYYRFSRLIYEGLFEFDDDLNLVGLLASEYNISENGRIVDITLKDNIKWHDGSSFSAEDVIFTIEAIKSAGGNSIYGELLSKGIGSYGGPNIHSIINASGSGNNVRISFDRPTSNNLEVLTFPIVPKHIFASVTAALVKDNYRVVGTGPFKYESYTKMKELNLVANTEYRDGRPYLDKVSGKILDSEEDVLRAFETGQVNMALSVGVDWEKYGRNSRVKVIEYVSSDYEFLGFNFQKDIFAGEEGKKLRQAIMYGIDRESIIDRVYLGHATANDLPINPNSWLNSDSSNSYGYDAEKAVEKLAQAGFKEKDERGFYKKANGERLSLNLLTNTLSPVRNGIALSIKDNLEDIGIEVIISPEEMTTELTTDEQVEGQWEVIKSKIGRGEFDIVLSGWNLSPIPDLSFMFHSGHMGGELNFIRYSDPETDGKIINSLTAGESRDSKKNAYSQLGQDLVDKLPYGSLFFRNKALLMDKKIEGKINPNIFNPYRGIEKVFLNIEE